MSRIAERKLPRKFLVTNALPYANGPIHLGHLVVGSPGTELEFAL